MNRKQQKIKGLLSIVILAISLCLLLLAEISDGFGQWYSEKCYAVLVAVFGRIYSIFPFSVSEIGLYIVGIVIGITLVKFVVKLVRKKPIKGEVLRAFMNVTMAVSILFFIFTVSCGINYKRTSFSEQNEMKVEAYTTMDLRKLCERLTQEVNQWSEEVSRNEKGLAVPTSEDKENAREAMMALGVTYEDLKGYYPKPKGLLFPEILSYQSLSGIYSPFTIEANYNSAMTPYNIPFVQCHELSHLRGFMQEEEANFIAYLACKESKEPFFQYSGSLLGWLYSTNVLATVDPEGYEAIKGELLPEVNADLEENSRFWNQYEGVISEVSNQVNDTYLKANGQNDGVESYDRMVDLLVAYYKNK